VTVSEEERTACPLGRLHKAERAWDSRGFIQKKKKKKRKKEEEKKKIKHWNRTIGLYSTGNPIREMIR